MMGGVGRFYDGWVHKLAGLDQMRSDLALAAEELKHEAGRQTKEGTSLLQLEQQVARLSYDLKAHMREHRR